MIPLDGTTLTIEQLIDVACNNAKVAPLSDDIKNKLSVSQRWIKKTIEEDEKTIYGINTGFGPLSKVRVEAHEASILSRNVILACIVGVGPALPVEVVRAMMLVRANTLSSGYSGVRPVVIQTLIDMLNAGVTPYIPSKGSLGASGDLAPLSHMTVALTRDIEDGDGGYSGKAYYQGELMTGAEAMVKADIKRIKPEAKEGLALCNGTTFMVAAAAIAVYRATNLINNAELAAALSLEALTGLSAAFHPKLQIANRLPGQVETAANIISFVNGSKLVDSEPNRVQDAYALRCIPQVLGPIRSNIAYVRSNIEPLLNGATDNPLIFGTGDGGDDFITVSGGNFHGEGIAMWLDFLSIAVAEIGSFSERRTFRLVTPELSNGLPAMLVSRPGLNTGLMMPQYTAAALVSENKTLAHPDSVDSIPSSANQEDHVSMGANAARHTLEIIKNVTHIIAIEMLTASQGIDLRENGPERMGETTSKAYQVIRAKLSPVEKDRQLADDIEMLAEMVHNNELISKEMSDEQ